MGFSIIGLIIVVSIFLPNLLMLICPPINTPKMLSDKGLIYTVVERIGQAGCIIFLIFSTSFKVLTVNPWIVMMVICILIYYGLWIRYVIKGRAFSLLFDPLLFIPVPMAIFPVVAFAFAAVLGKSLLLGISVILLALGHSANSWHTYQMIKFEK